MKIKLSLALIAGITLLSFTNVKAQTTPTPSPGALKAAEEMLLVSGGGEQFGKNLSAGVEQMSAQIAVDKRDKFVAGIKIFMNKYCSWDSMKGDLCQMYANEFTEAELKQLSAFYRTPLGIKLNQKLPLITKNSMVLGQKAVAEHQAELEQIMMEAMQ